MTTLTDILLDVAEEFDRSNAKHGDPERRGIDYVLLGCDPKEAAAKYEIPTATRAKMFCRVNASRGILTHADILLEKLCEAVEAATIGTPEELYAELIQVAAMAVKWARQVKR
jgi:hypothetical protein